MLYLIGGAPRCGKTIVARRLARARCCSHIPTDYLGTAFSNYIPAAALPARYPAWQTSTVDERYERYSSAEIIAHYRIKAATTWPGLRDVLVYALHDQHEMVVEGYHLEPAFVYELREKHPQFAIRTVFLCRTDPGQLAADLQRSADPADWVLRSASKQATFERVAATMCDYSGFFQTEAQAYGFPVCSMNSSIDESFDSRIARAMAALGYE